MRGLIDSLGIRLVERWMGAGVLGCTLRSIETIVLSPSGYAARDEFTLAHEVLEYFAPAEWNTLPRETKEAICDRGAAALLLPALPFKIAVREHGIDLAALRRRWRLASWATIAHRLVDLGAASTASGWDSESLAWRYGGEEHPSEGAALRQARRRGRGWVAGARAWRLSRGRATVISV
jgi:hypothetical protein